MLRWVILPVVLIAFGARPLGAATVFNVTFAQCIEAGSLTTAAIPLSNNVQGASASGNCSGDLFTSATYAGSVTGDPFTNTTLRVRYNFTPVSSLGGLIDWSVLFVLNGVNAADSGSTLSGTPVDGFFDIALPPSTPLGEFSYTVGLTQPGETARLTVDIPSAGLQVFAPGDTTPGTSSVPEPGTALLLVSGMALIRFMRLR